ncbi:MAG: hypothetical protein H7122_00715, partial [Chitinophagaceae bacterium]|nr:hypothetical protein [Chitinophagaceae bacterium]
MEFSKKVYYISEHTDQEIFHGGIGPMDIEKILKRNDAIAIRFPYHFDFSIRAKVMRVVYLIKTFLRIEAGSVIVFQHPLYARMNKLLLQILRLRKTVVPICLIADIDGIKDGNEFLLQKEMNWFRQFNYF